MADLFLSSNKVLSEFNSFSSLLSFNKGRHVYCSSSSSDEFMTDSPLKYFSIIIECDRNKCQFAHLFSILFSSNLESSLLNKIYYRSFSILQAWIEDCYSVDFAINPDLMGVLKTFINSEVTHCFDRKF